MPDLLFDGPTVFETFFIGFMVLELDLVRASGLHCEMHKFGRDFVLHHNSVSCQWFYQ